MFTYSVEGCNAANVTGLGRRLCVCVCMCVVVTVKSLEPESLGLNYDSIVFGKLLNPFVSQFLHL